MFQRWYKVAHKALNLAHAVLSSGTPNRMCLPVREHLTFELSTTILIIVDENKIIVLRLPIKAVNQTNKGIQTRLTKRTSKGAMLSRAISGIDLNAHCVNSFYIPDIVNLIIPVIHSVYLTRLSNKLCASVKHAYEQ